MTTKKRQWKRKNDKSFPTLSQPSIILTWIGLITVASPKITVASPTCLVHDCTRLKCYKPASTRRGAIRGGSRRCRGGSGSGGGFSFDASEIDANCVSDPVTVDVVVAVAVETDDARVLASAAARATNGEAVVDAEDEDEDDDESDIDVVETSGAAMVTSPRVTSS